MTILWLRLERRPMLLSRRDVVRDGTPHDRPRGLIHEGDIPPRPSPPFPLSPGSLTKAASPTAVRADFSAEAVIPTAVSWPGRRRRTRSPSLPLVCGDIPRGRPRRLVRGNDDPRGHLVAASAAQAGRAPPDPSPRTAMTARTGVDTVWLAEAPASFAALGPHFPSPLR